MPGRKEVWAPCSRSSHWFLLSSRYDLQLLHQPDLNNCKSHLCSVTPTGWLASVEHRRSATRAEHGVEQGDERA